MRIRIWTYIQECDLIACSLKFELLDRFQCVQMKLFTNQKVFPADFEDLAVILTAEKSSK